MAQILPCIQGRMGSTNYYQAVIPARTLTSIARPAREMDDWAAQGVEERLQRDLNGKRIKEEIVPYLVHSADRFFGSIIVLVHKPEVFEYESLERIIGDKVPVAYRRDGKKMGFLTIDGGELVALDGQHRLVALRQVVQKEYEGMGEFESAVPLDDVSVIFIEFESNEKTRRIFNKVNRYAKPTGRGDNILMSEDDGFSIVCRRLLSDGAPLSVKDERGGLLVNWKSNTLAANSTQFTTISAVYETVRDILARNGMANFNERTRVNRPSDEELDEAYVFVEEWWDMVLKNIEGYRLAIEKVTSIPKLRGDSSEYSLLFKPVTQIALFRGLLDAVEKGISKMEAVRRANLISWSISDPMWQEILVSVDGRMLAQKTNYELAARLINYLVGAENMTEAEINNFKREYLSKKGSDDTILFPEPVH